MKTFAMLALAAALPFAAQSAAAADWYPSAYGAKDEIGAANLLTPEGVKQAVGLVRTGKTYPLAVPVDKNLPAFRHRSFRLYNIQPGEQAGQSLGPNRFTFNDELVNAWTGVGTQLNGIGHIGIDNRYYNGNQAADFVTVEGVKKLGIEKVPPFVTRGVVLDMTAHYGKDIVPGGTEFSVADIQAVLKKQGLALRKGDVVLFNTGWLELIGRDNKQFLEVEPGIGMEAAKWLADQGIVAFGGDTWASEVYPNPHGKDEFPVNQYMLAKRGIYNLELIDSRALVRDQAWEFLFVLGQPLYVGSTQVNINPVAIR
ncbi:MULTISPECIES: cyclase family protein [Pseudomonas aeruginosa group]|uniref:Cyclase family protein n=1 Tax=Pseudomonas paraeruginosa TaxID=2994495 RepID=A0A2R3J054_9PSED|nr:MULTISPECIES: cyclase family protein [Pseudomonas aeruginosa group]VTS39655.1 Putative cyclase [Streptococcus dysgalactiae subsp. equisimilis]AVK07554.1 cyclase family protein [Pseudomonas paraeruginosa]AWE90702.1 cyclase family protein [Pseudomonas paraeruginosa]KRU86586.1 polyketide cyclase [Pseudomonas aeruginosa]KSD77933.1 polyketide cyclase [Pseudomonas aeruginosa]